MAARTLGRIIVALMLTAAASAELLPRQSLSKPGQLTRPAAPCQLIVKFQDGLRVRAEAGALTAADDKALTRIRALVQPYGAVFRALIQLPQAKLDALVQRAAARSGRMQPDLAGMLVVTAPEARLAALAEALHRSPDTE